MLKNLSANFDEHQWVEQIRQTLKEELEEETEIPVTIFAVPKVLKDINPGSYTPREVAIGPYHHLQPELYDMERYKVSAARRCQKEFRDDLNLEHFVDHLMNYEVWIRSSYHRHLNYGGEALAWMMTIDACFLLDFFQVCGVKKSCKALDKVPSRLFQLIDLSGNRITYNDILKDITMLENQIPLFVMRALLEYHLSSLELADEVLLSMLTGLSKDLSPFKMGKCPRRINVKDCAHFLAFLYRFIVPTSEVNSEIIDINEEDCMDEIEREEPDSFSEHGYVHQLASMVGQILLNVVAVKAIILSKPIELLSKLPWTIISKIPIVRIILKGPIENMLTSFNPNINGQEDDEGPSNPMAKPPLLEEIMIPCVNELSKVGVKFVPTDGGITSIDFDQKTLTLSIPTIVLDVNSDVVLRNLVAYEACTCSGPLVLSRYTELMNGIIDTEMDVRILCQRGIIINHLKSEKEVSDLWNGMSKSIRLTKVPSLDNMIADVNRYYDGRMKVKCGRFLKRHVYNSWKFLTLLAAVMVMLLMSLQSFCQVYSCSRLLHIHGLHHPNDDGEDY